MADLLAELKSRLQITWADSITDQVLMQHIIRSKNILMNYVKMIFI